MTNLQNTNGTTPASVDLNAQSDPAYIYEAPALDVSMPQPSMLSGMSCGEVHKLLNSVNMEASVEISPALRNALIDAGIFDSYSENEFERQRIRTSHVSSVEAELQQAERRAESLSAQSQRLESSWVAQLGCLIIGGSEGLEMTQRDLDTLYDEQCITCGNLQKDIEERNAFAEKYRHAMKTETGFVCISDKGQEIRTLLASADGSIPFEDFMLEQKIH